MHEAEARAASEQRESENAARQKAARRGQRALRLARKRDNGRDQHGKQPRKETPLQGKRSHTSGPPPTKGPKSVTPKRNKKKVQAHPETASHTVSADGNDAEVRAINKKLHSARQAAQGAAAAARHAGPAKRRCSHLGPKKHADQQLLDDTVVQRALPYISPSRPCGTSPHTLDEIPNGAALLQSALNGATRRRGR